jgi:hypothetical protein
MKCCNKCKQLKPLSEYTRQSNKKDGLNRSCRTCTRAWVKGHYDRNRAVYMAKAKRQRERLIEWMRIRKEQPCVDCNQSYPYYVMDFDHRHSKKLNLGNFRRYGRQQVLAEIDKCDLVCANCHRFRTHARLVKGRSRPATDGELAV